MKLIVIGCGAAGATAAQFARKNDRKAEIKVFERGKYPQYSKCALPFVISGELSPESVIEFDEEWFRKARIDLHLNTPVSDIDFGARTVETREGQEEYDALVIATGASPFTPINPEGKTYFLRSLDDALAIREETRHAKEAVIIGAGLIGLEAAEALTRTGMKVTIVEFLPDILLTMVDEDIARVVRKRIDGKVEMLFEYKVTKIREVEGNGGSRSRMEVTAVDGNGNEILLHGDFVIVSTGNTANTELAKFTAKGERAIDVNERCETSVKNVYAVGDCTRYVDILGNGTIVGLGSIGVRQGMVAGANAIGGDEIMMPLVNARTTKIFGVEVAAVGPLGRNISFSPVTGKFKGSALPEYMATEKGGGEGKGEGNIFIKVYTDGKGRLVGAQAVGPEATQRINKFSLAIHYGLTTGQLSKVETAYAPALAPVIDASTLACEIANRRIK